MFKPCKNSKMMVEVTNDGYIWSGVVNLNGVSILATTQELPNGLNANGTLYEEF